MYQSIRLGFGLGLVCVAAMGCSGSDDAAVGQPMGSVGLAVETTGPDGATYRLTPQTVFHVHTPDYSFQSALEIYGPETVQAFDLPPGAYVADVFSVLPGGGFEIQRTEGSQTELVDARYVGVNPTPFSIAANRSTALTLPFRVPEIGDVTFDTGRLGVDLDVDVETASPNGGQVTLTGARITEQSFGGELEDATEFVTPGDASVTQTIGWAITGPFALNGYRRACAAIRLTTVTTSELAWAGLFSIVPNSVGVLCVNDGPSADTVTITGQARPTVQGSGLDGYLTASSYELYTSVVGQVSANIFDGNTLHLDQLVDAVSQGDLSAMYWLIGDDGVSGVTQAQVGIQGPGRVQTWAN